MKLLRHLIELWYISSYMRKYKLTYTEVKNALFREYMIQNASLFRKYVNELKGEAEKAEGTA